MKTKKTMAMGTALFLSVLMLATLSCVLAATDDTAQGSFTLNATPSVTNVDFQTDAYVTTSTLTPDATTYFRLNFTVSSAGTLNDILNVTAWIYDDSVYGATYNTSSPDGLQLVRILWVEDTDTWTINQGTFTEWSIDNSGSDDPGADPSVTTFEYSARFQISRAARYDTDWNATVHVYDDDSPTAEVDYATETALVTMNQNFEISYSASTFSWGSNVQPNSVNNTHGALSINIYANDQWELRINATDFNTSGQSDVDIEAQNILAWDQDGSNGGISQWVRNTIATLPTGSTWDNQAPMSTETALTRNCYYFLSTGTYFVVGYTWSTWVTVWIQANV